jgi:hypothetical protein
VLNRAGGQTREATPNVQRFTASGTWTKPTGARWVRRRVWGGGGAGGGAVAASAAQHSVGAGGGAGGYAETLSPASSLGATVTVTVPAAATGVSGAAGNSGGTVSFGTDTVATGGPGEARPRPAPPRSGWPVGRVGSGRPGTSWCAVPVAETLGETPILVLVVAGGPHPAGEVAGGARRAHPTARP